MNWEKKSQEPTQEDALAQELAAVYYDGETIGKQLKPLVGAEEASNLSVVNQQLDKGCETVIKEVGE
jgi:hypothetical protein